MMQAACARRGRDKNLVSEQSGLLNGEVLPAETGDRGGISVLGVHAAYVSYRFSSAEGVISSKIGHVL